MQGRRDIASKPSRDALIFSLFGRWDFDCTVTVGMVGLVGLEPTISPLWAVRFNQLNYKPLLLSTCYSLTSRRADVHAKALLYLLLAQPGQGSEGRERGKWGRAKRLQTLCLKGWYFKSSQRKGSKRKGVEVKEPNKRPGPFATQTAGTLSFTLYFRLA